MTAADLPLLEIDVQRRTYEMLRLQDQINQCTDGAYANSGRMESMTRRMGEARRRIDDLVAKEREA